MLRTRGVRVWGVGVALAPMALALSAVPEPALAAPATPRAITILPPGEGNTITVPAFLANQASGNCADLGPHTCDQLDMYKNWQFKATIPELLLKEVSASYGKVSEFTERAFETQLQLDRQAEMLETLAGRGNRARGRKVLDDIEKEPGFAELTARWDREQAEDMALMARLERRNRKSPPLP